MWHAFGGVAQLVERLTGSQEVRGFESLRLHRPGRCANRIVLRVAPTNRNTEDRVDGLSAIHPDFVDERLKQGLDWGRVTAGQGLGHPVTERRQFLRRWGS